MKGRLFAFPQSRLSRIRQQYYGLPDSDFLPFAFQFFFEHLPALQADFVLLVANNLRSAIPNFVAEVAFLHAHALFRPRTGLAYCLSYTTTLFTSRPCESLPLNVEVLVFPSVETFDVTVITTWSPFFMVAWIVLAPMRFTDTVSP
jgi:hypothetical protein